MADWLDVIAEQLIEVAQTDLRLANLINETVKMIERNPTLGTFTQGTGYFYTDKENGFRITYEYPPHGKLEMVSLNTSIVSSNSDEQ